MMRVFWIIAACVVVGLAVHSLITLGGTDQPQEAEEQRVKIYSSIEACKAEQSAETCDQAFAGALQTHQASAPRYETRASCEDLYGPPGCVPYHESNHDWFMPAMMGFMLGHALGDSRPIYQPIYIDRYRTAYIGRDSIGTYRDDSGGSGYVYNTSPTVSRRSGTSVSNIWSSRGYGVQSVSRPVTRGGFGATASLVASRSGGGLGG